MIKKIGIYKIENKINKKVYIGSSKDLASRKQSHFKSLIDRKSHNPYLQRAFNKYGIENFEFIIIEECFLNDLIAKEAFYINLYKSDKAEFGYNIMTSASGRITHNKETLKKLSDKIKNKWQEKEYREKLIKAAKNKFLNPVYKEKQAKINIGKVSWNKGLTKETDSRVFGTKHTKEWKQKTSKRMTENNPMKGKRWKHKEEDRIKISVNNGRNRPVIRLDEAMSIINRFYNISEAYRQTGINNIIPACKNPNRTSGGFKWMYEVDYKNQLIECLLSA